MYQVTIRSLSKKFGATPVLRNIDLEIAEGEFFFLLGPSGCGKTTLLRIITGFEQPDSGDVLFNDTVVNSMPPQKRNTSMVFQNYALWPHLTVEANVAYGLENRKFSKTDTARLVGEALELVRMNGYEKRLPNQLSGGQQQRVALARALVVKPELLLLDEPLSNLDARLRSEMRIELLRLHRETGITTIYVTHDQEEALSLADRIAFLDEGRLVQVDTPRGLYWRPANVKTGRFLGNANIIEGLVKSSQGPMVQVETPLGIISGMAAANFSPQKGCKAFCFFRPESMAAGGSGFGGKVIASMYTGSREHLYLEHGDIKFQALIPAMAEPPTAGSAISFDIAADHVVILGE